MKYVSIAICVVALAGCMGPQYATDDGICREQARQKIRTYDDCRKMMVEGHRQDFLINMQSRQLDFRMGR
jgi:hypothetical protein